MNNPPALKILMTFLTFATLMTVAALASFPPPSFARSGKGSAESREKGSRPSSLSRDVVLDGTVVNGKYHAAGDLVSTVESEKSLIDLVGLRSDFKDRLRLERRRLLESQRAAKK